MGSWRGPSAPPTPRACFAPWGRTIANPPQGRSSVSNSLTLILWIAFSVWAALWFLPWLFPRMFNLDRFRRAPLSPAPPCTSPTTPPLMEIRLRINVPNLGGCGTYEECFLSLNGKPVSIHLRSLKMAEGTRTSGVLETSDIALLKQIQSSLVGKRYLGQHPAHFLVNSIRRVMDAFIVELLSALLNSAEVGQGPPLNKSPRE